MNLILIRHGETEWNKQGLCQGKSDINLSEFGKVQATHLSQSLKDHQIDSIYSSNLKRAYETAELIAENHGVNVEVEDGLREMDQGDFEGKPFVKLRETHGEVLQSWRADPANFRIPNGETLQEVQDRAFNAINNISINNEGKTVLIVSHNFTIITLLCKFQGTSLDDFYKYKISETSKHIINFKDDRYTIETFNNTDHLSNLN
ncbi:MAG: histidine phosphatase family protein [Candidatus Dadabacteria bacterium]|nr:histidine phosphatase family protein [Candidatus Dadabacteria bacterium]